MIREEEEEEKREGLERVSILRKERGRERERDR